MITHSSQTLSAINVAVRRSFASVQSELTQGKAAFILGAGVDILIARDFAGEKDLPPDWPKLIGGLRPFSTLGSNSESIASIQNIANNWPAEAASLARWWIGDGEFQKDIQSHLDNDLVINGIRKGIPEKTSTRALCRLLIQSNLIITPNYSSYLIHALRSFEPNIKTVVIDREDLPSLPFPESEENPRTIFVIHLHGRCSARSFPILDAWGYNILLHDDHNYVEFLRRLFTDRSVITIGVSWSDPPLRSAAAFVQRTRPYLSKKHLALRFVAPSEEDTFGNANGRSDPKGLARLWSDAMRAAYGVDILFVDDKTQLQRLQQLGSDQSAHCSKEAINGFRHRLDHPGDNRLKLIDAWRQTANFLDSCGDYESPLQHRFLGIFSGSDTPTAKDITGATQTLAAKLLDFLSVAGLGNEKKLECEQWCIAATIERHLRHHLYLYRPQQESNFRQKLWRLLWERLPFEEWNEIPLELRFDFLLGKFELKLDDVNLAERKPDLGHFENRFSKALLVWTHAPGSIPPTNEIVQKDTSRDMQKLAVDLLDLGWESVAAKVLCDLMHFWATIANATDLTMDHPLAKTTLEHAVHASRLSRSSGCFRRQVKADSIAAMWMPDPLEGRVQLLGNIRASEETRSVEPGLLGGLGAALLTCDLRAKISAGKTIIDLRTLANDLFDEAGLDRVYLYDALKYWIPFTPKEIGKRMWRLKGEMNVELVSR